jgi:hypothetical protein
VNICWYLIYFPWLFLFKNKKFWEELIAYFPFVLHGPHIERRLQQFFFAAGTSLPSCYLSAIGWYTDTRGQQFFSCCVYSLPREHAYLGLVEQWKEGYILPSLCLATTGGIHIRTHRLMGRFYEVCVEMGSGAMIYRVSQEERLIFWEVIVSAILSKKLYTRMYTCPIRNGFRDRAISLYSSKIIDKKEILRTVSNTGIYCSNDKVGTVS